MPKNAIESKSKMWNLWHGCHKLSAGCQHCYVYRGDAKRGIDSRKPRTLTYPFKRSAMVNTKSLPVRWSIPVLLPTSSWKMPMSGVRKPGR